MTFSRDLNRGSVTSTRLRIPESSPSSGICAVCLDGCPGTCEIAKSSFRGREVLYPEPFGKVTAGSTKEYPVDFSHFNIQGTCVGAYGIEADPDKAIFPNVNVETIIGKGEYKIKLKVPIFTGALGSTDIARNNWEGMAIGSAISGIALVIGENVCGMDPDAEFKNGRVIKSPELERRVRLFQEWYEGYGEVLVQHNVEDGRARVPEYAVEKLGVKAIEIKWGQGAKDIGGEVKLFTLEMALKLKQRGYVVLPDPEDRVIQKAFKDGVFKEFERHSRLGMVDEEEFIKEVEYLRKIGVKFVSLKTGAYRPRDLALALKLCSLAKVDLLTVDGAGGGTGMSPWRMMNEWGIPTVYIECLLYEYAKKLHEKGKYIPSLAIGGALSFEDHIFKALALGAPFVKAVCMGRATMIPAMVGKNIGIWIKEGKLPKNISQFGHDIEHIFVTSEILESKYADKYKMIPPSAIGLYTYIDRIKTGLQQLMAGARKFTLDHISRDDIVALTKEASEVSGIPYVMDCDREAVEKILDF